jgi:hypothetical protein
MMKAVFWAVAAMAILILSGAAAYAEEAAPTDKGPADEYIFPVNQKSAQTLYEMKERRMKAAEAKRAEEEEKQREKEKQAKVEKIQRKTGRSSVSWQVQNR